MATILEDVHEGLGLPSQASRAACVKGKYAYYHYGCDGVDDRGWGCGYRTLQTICSWVVHHKHKTGEQARAVPSITEIQAALVTLGDKEAQFNGSRDWIGSTEVFLCLDHFYQVPCRILHASTGGEVANHVDALLKHFEQQGSPVMMGSTRSTAAGYVDLHPVHNVYGKRLIEFVLVKAWNNIPSKIKETKFRQSTEIVFISYKPLIWCLYSCLAFCSLRFDNLCNW
ncbi:ufm1-specific protease 1 isoform X2 [Dermacentor andersoni]|uniref:ufm1-specific protease 1 isoform X2 n=1 Tax=Dermacentor andersoni TaxID=34620 RepID=UPI003B3BD737